eukprot:g19557.t1
MPLRTTTRPLSPWKRMGLNACFSIGQISTVARFYPARSLDKLYNFVECSGLHLILGLNALLRNPDNSWNGSSGLSLLKYCAGKKYNISWELGN